MWTWFSCSSTCNQFGQVDKFLCHFLFTLVEVISHNCSNAVSRSALQEGEAFSLTVI